MRTNLKITIPLLLLLVTACAPFKGPIDGLNSANGTPNLDEGSLAVAGKPNNAATLANGLYSIINDGVIYTASGQYCAFRSWQSFVKKTGLTSVDTLPKITIAQKDQLNFIGDCDPGAEPVEIVITVHTVYDPNSPSSMRPFVGGTAAPGSITLNLTDVTYFAKSLKKSATDLDPCVAMGKVALEQGRALVLKTDRSNVIATGQANQISIDAKNGTVECSLK